MASFTTRVELHGADDNDYDVLHDAMARRGFSRTIISSEDIEYYLPAAEYNYVGAATAKEVFTLAKAAAGETGCRSSILVTESANRVWEGLELV